MEQPEKKSINLEELVGTENAKVLLEHVDTACDVMHELIVQVVTDHSKNLFASTQNTVTQLGSWDEDKIRIIMDLVRDAAVDRTACGLLVLAGVAQSENPRPMSEYAHHSLTHYEEALKEQQLANVTHTLKRFLVALRHPPAKERTDKNKASEN